MKKLYNPEDFNIKVGTETMKKGRLNNICDVKGVTVGHSTLDYDDVKTGVTIINPSVENPFVHKLVAACEVLNGFGKTLGSIQIDELGTLETPIALTNTLSVGVVHQGIVKEMISRCQNENVPLFSINPVVGECNDCTINNIKKLSVTEDNVREAFNNLCADFELGDIGAGKGMICHGLKGGIGSSSRVFEVNGKEYTLGVLVLTNHGKKENLLINGNKLFNSKTPEFDKGSCMIIMATDLPLSSRQLKRILKRSAVGLARLGSYIGNGSGEIALGFTTANKRTWSADIPFEEMSILNESLMELAFVAIADSVEESILRSMLNAEPAVGLAGEKFDSLRNYL